MAASLDLQVKMQLDLAGPLGQVRAVPVRCGQDNPHLLLVHGPDRDVDPFVEMFFYPSGTLTMTMVDPEGGIVWQRDLGPGVVPGMWFCDFNCADLDADGVDEVYFVNNTDPDHPLAMSKYVLERLDARTGETTGRRPWSHLADQRLSYAFRNFVIAGRTGEGDILVTAQGTYGQMSLQGWTGDLEPRWSRLIEADEPGARGSHMAPIVDIDEDGRQELLWGERCIRLDTGEELFCCDRANWAGHSDIIWPFREPGGAWRIFTARESEGPGHRAAVFDARGAKVWSDVDTGHMDMGWVARLGPRGEPVSMAIRVGHKSAGPSGRQHRGVEEFTWDAATGEPVDLPFAVYETLPVDLDGDGRDELIRGYPGGDGAILNADGAVVGRIRGVVALRGHFQAGSPDAHVLTWEPGGAVRLYVHPGDKAGSAGDRLTNLTAYDQFYRL